MTKKELLRKLQDDGNFYPEMINWTKARLEKEIEIINHARSLSLEELILQAALHGAIK